MSICFRKSTKPVIIFLCYLFGCSSVWAMKPGVNFIRQVIWSNGFKQCSMPITWLHTCGYKTLNKNSSRVGLYSHQNDRRLLLQVDRDRVFDDWLGIKHYSQAPKEEFIGEMNDVFQNILKKHNGYMQACGQESVASENLFNISLAVKFRAFSSNLIDLILLDGCQHAFENIKNDFLKVTSKKKLSDNDKHALICFFCYSGAEQPVGNITKYGNLDLQSQFLDAGLRPYPSLHWKEIYSFLYGKYVNELRSLYGDTVPNPDSISLLDGVEIKRVGESYVSLKSMSERICFKDQIDCSKISRLGKFEFPATIETILSFLAPHLEALTGVSEFCFEKTALDAVFDLLSGFDKLKEGDLEKDLMRFCFVGGKNTLEDIDDLIRLPSCVQDENKRGLYRVLIFGAYLSTLWNEPYDNHSFMRHQLHSPWFDGKFQMLYFYTDFNDRISMSRGVGKKQPLYEVPVEKRHEVSKKNFECEKKFREFLKTEQR